MATQPSTVDVEDARKVYLHVFDAFADTPADIARDLKGINAKYARQILADLIGHNLVVFSEGDGDDFEDAWQCMNTYDDIDREAAEALFNTTYESESKMTTTTTSPKPKAEPKPCKCGCGEQVPGKSFYRPGHDARHAGNVGREIAAHYHEEGYDRRVALDDLPSDALKAKAEGIAEKQIEKIEARLAREAAKANRAGEVNAGDDGTEEVEHGVVKVGKNEYAAVRYVATGEVNYFVGDETKVASKTAAKSFTS